MTGAARLAAGAAHRVGAGLVTLLAPDAAAAALYRAGDPGTIVSEAGLEALLADDRRRAWLIGPGLPGDAATRAALRRLVEAGRQVVADAGALTACAGAPAALAGCAVLTPHAGEFARVFGPIGADRLAAARAAAAATGAVVLLKGADTVIAAPDGRAAINANAPPSLATGGTGDVLAGSIAALLAQGMEPFAAAGCGCLDPGRGGARTRARAGARRISSRSCQMPWNWLASTPGRADNRGGFHHVSGAAPEKTEAMSDLALESGLLDRALGASPASGATWRSGWWAARRRPSPSRCAPASTAAAARSRRATGRPSWPRPIWRWMRRGGSSSSVPWPASTATRRR